MPAPSVKVLFVPGLCCRSDIWEGARTHLPHVDAVALDWPWPERIESYDDGAAWLAYEIRTHRPRFVVGHSIGGIIALHLRGVLREQRDWDLVVVESFLIEPHEFFRNHVWQTMPALREWIAAMLAEERPRFPVLREVAVRDEPPGWRERVLAEPAAFIYGARSGEHAVEALGEMAGIPRGGGHDIRLVAETSHFPMLEEPARFYAVLGEVMAWYRQARLGGERAG